MGEIKNSGLFKFSRYGLAYAKKPNKKLQAHLSSVTTWTNCTS